METVCHPPTFFCLSLSLPALSSSIQIKGTLLAQKRHFQTSIRVPTYSNSHLIMKSERM